MRMTGIAIIMGSLALSACATKPKPAPVATGSSCPPLTHAQWGPPLQAANDEMFGAALERRFGSKGQHGRVEERSVDARGDQVFIMGRIGPAKFEMPEPGQGGRVMVVLQPCTAKVLKVRKLSDLEAQPRPLAPREEPEA